MRFTMQKRAAAPREVARIFSCSPRKVYDAVKSGFVESHKLGRSSLVFLDDFEQYLRAQPRTRSPSKTTEVPHVSAR
jgi:excisionase family DNA binding protein